MICDSVIGLLSENILLSSFALICSDLAILLVSKTKGMPSLFNFSNDYLAPIMIFPFSIRVPSISMANPNLCILEIIDN